MTTPIKGVSMKYILLVIPFLFIGCASEPNYKYDSIVAIETIRETSCDYIVQYNKLNYQYKKNKFN